MRSHEEIDYEPQKGILIIEDDEDLQELLRKLLGSAYRIFQARTAEEGLNILCDEIRLIFLDYLLPDLSGLELIKRIKKIYPSIPIIFITGYGNENVCRDAFRYGVRDYIKKPFELEEIRLKADLFMSNMRDSMARINYLSNCEYKENKMIQKRMLSDPNLLKVAKVKDYLDENWDDNFSLSEVSKMAGMNTTYFCNYFKLLTGHSFKGYYHRIKIEKAKEMLMIEKLSIKDISSTLGFNSISYFGEIFKKISGLTPQEFRKHAVTIIRLLIFFAITICYPEADSIWSILG